MNNLRDLLTYLEVNSPNILQTRVFRLTVSHLIFASLYADPKEGISIYSQLRVEAEKEGITFTSYLYELVRGEQTSNLEVDFGSLAALVTYLLEGNNSLETKVISQKQRNKAMEIVNEYMLSQNN
ncbi:hypothetical protein H6G33_09740 [Calothrix sp. FACHB-1219]|uniref:hypothetical protein n=1 Tax=unclassified Calothrix TaxID=2619626 RepID=UPI0016871984|nr:MULTISPECIES: hypothetical protein [unclassified Calothrix]MBD2201628.1 hypothetical protein [Calothrix sp. FACHB-168]MBD2217314.1 hypothetical protein [Calothrix sp. FACHB-1219]